MRELALRALDTATTRGASYADVRFVRRRTQSVVVKNAVVHDPISGEPIELARRFCTANHPYGSKILICTRTFDLASKAIVARPIDFVKGLD